MILGSVILLSLALLSPSVQESLVNYLVKKVNVTYGTHISLNGIKVSVYEGITLEGLSLKDDDNDTLAYADRVYIDVSNFKEILSEYPSFNHVVLENPILRFKIDKGRKKGGWEQFKKMFTLDSVSKEEEKTPFLLSDIEIKNGKLIIETKDGEASKDLNFEKINAAIKEIKIQDTQSYFIISHFSSKADFTEIKNLQGRLTVSSSRYILNDFYLETKASKIRGNLSCGTSLDRDMPFDINIKKSEIQLSDINHFTNLNLPDKTIYVDFRLQGNLNNMRFKRLFLETEKSFLKIEAKVKNIRGGLEHMTLQSKISGGILNISEARELLKDLNFSFLNVPNPVEEVAIYGIVDLDKSNLQTDLRIKTSISDVDIKSFISGVYDPEHMMYKGSATIYNIMWQKSPKYIDLRDSKCNLTFSGTGYKKGSLNTHFSAILEKLRYKGYLYKNVEIEGGVSAGKLNLRIEKRGDNMDFLSTVAYNFKDSTNTLSVNLDLREVALERISDYFEAPSLLRCKSDLTLVIDSEKRWGEIDFKDISYTSRGKVFKFKDFEISIDTDEKRKFFQINSPDIVSGQMQGDLDYKHFMPLLKSTLANIYKSRVNHLQGDSDESFFFSLDFHESFFKAFIPSISIKEGTKVSGNLTSSGMNMYLNFDSPMLKVYNTKIYAPHIRVNNDRDDNVIINIKKIENNIYDVEDLQTFSYFKRDTLFFKTMFRGNKISKDHYDLNYYFTINKQDRYVLGMKSSTLRFRENDWRVNEDNNLENKVEIDPNTGAIDFKELALKYKNEKAVINGLFSKIKTSAQVNLENIDLSHVTGDVVGFSLDGLLNVNVDFDGGKKMNNSSFNIEINQLHIEEHFLGNVSVSAKSNNEYLFLKAQLDNKNQKVISLRGLVSRELDLNLTTKLNRFNVNFIDFSNEIVSQIHGIVSGNLQIKGKLTKPEISGYVDLYKAGITLPYTKIHYLAEDESRVMIDSKNFHFKDVMVYEKEFNTRSYLDGYIQHSNFSNWFYNLKLRSGEDKSLFSNTLDIDNDYYYGKCMVLGDAHLLGYSESLKLDVNLDLVEGTKAFIPIKDIVQDIDDSFVKIKIKNQNKKPKKISDFTSDAYMDISVNLNINPEADINVSVKGISGLSIDVNGFGKVSIESNTNRDLDIWGNYTLSKGGFTMYYMGVISKYFSLSPGGSITWYGDLFEGTLRDVRGVYSLNANPDTLTGELRFTREIRTDVTMILNGNVMQPKTRFQIDFPDTASYLKSYLGFYISNDQEIQTQSLALITGGRFQNKTSQDLNIGRSNFDESISRLISSILKDKNSKVKMGISYESINNQNNLILGNSIYGRNRLDVDLTSNLSDRIKFKGTVGLPTSGTQSNNVAGEGELEVLLNKKGTLSARIFNRRSDFNEILTQKEGYTKGVGLYYRVDFNTFSDLVSMILGSNLSRTKKEENDIEESLNKSSL